MANKNSCSEKWRLPPAGPPTTMCSLSTRTVTMSPPFIQAMELLLLRVTTMRHPADQESANTPMDPRPVRLSFQLGQEKSELFTSFMEKSPPFLYSPERG